VQGRDQVGAAYHPNQAAIAHNRNTLDVMSLEKLDDLPQCCPFISGDDRVGHQIARTTVVRANVLKKGRSELGTIRQQAEPPGTEELIVLSERAQQVTLTYHSQ
jgi:hypothetical protein